MLGYSVDKSTVAKYMGKRPQRLRRPSQTWGTFVRNHLVGTIAVDFLTVPTVTFGILYVFFVLSLDRRRVLHVNVAAHPHSAWAAQQVVEAMGRIASLEKLAYLRRFAAKSGKLSSEAAERLDAHVCAVAHRLRAAGRGARMPKRNDGADVSLTIHLGSGSLLVTEEVQLVEIVDLSGTFQRPWIRRLNDLDELPEGPPWGEDARRQAMQFIRRSASRE
jgi:hypothetical protein